VKKISQNDIKYFQSLIYEHSGIFISEHKYPVLKINLNKRMQQLGLTNIGEYRERINSNSNKTEIDELVNIVSINKTDFFRSKIHYQYLDKYIKKYANTNKHYYVWSAACSSGEEPYSIAISFCESLGSMSAQKTIILATDIDTKILDRAQKGVYSNLQIERCDRLILKKYVTKKGECNLLSPMLKKDIRFRYINLKKPFPFSRQFDIIFCSNVMIYFDAKTQGKLVNRLYEQLVPGGLLFVGESEAMTGINHPFKRIAASVYQK